MVAAVAVVEPGAPLEAQGTDQSSVLRKAAMALLASLLQGVAVAVVLLLLAAVETAALVSTAVLQARLLATRGAVPLTQQPDEAAHLREAVECTQE
jgi:hypothetical protein